MRMLDTYMCPNTECWYNKNTGKKGEFWVQNQRKLVFEKEPGFNAKNQKKKQKGKKK